MIGNARSSGFHWRGWSLKVSPDNPIHHFSCFNNSWSIIITGSFKGFMYFAYYSRRSACTFLSIAMWWCPLMRSLPSVSFENNSWEFIGLVFCKCDTLKEIHGNTHGKSMLLELGKNQIASISCRHQVVIWQLGWVGKGSTDIYKATANGFTIVLLFVAIFKNIKASLPFDEGIEEFYIFCLLNLFLMNFISHFNNSLNVDCLQL